MTETEKLIERLEKATGPDRQLDAALWYALIEKPRLGDKRDQDMIDRWPAYTASLDAALALVERVRPGWAMQVTLYPGNGWEASVDPYNVAHQDYPAATGKTAPLALCLALLRTLETSHD